MYTLLVTTKWGQLLKFVRNSWEEIIDLANIWVECSGYEITSDITGQTMLTHIVLESTRTS